MYVKNEEWEQNNQDYLKESYEETGFTTGGYAIRKCSFISQTDNGTPIWEL